MSTNERIKALMADLPLVEELWWKYKGARKPWSAHFKLEGIRQVLPGAVTDVEQLAQPNPESKKVLIFATLHYWIEQAALIALALAGQGHQVSLAYLPYSDWDKGHSKFDLKRQDLYARDVFKPAQHVMQVCSLYKEALEAREHPAEMDAAVRQVSRYDTMYTRQVENVDEQDGLYQFRLQQNSRAAAALWALMQRARPDVLIVPNGTILEMGVAYAVAQELGIQTVTFEFADQRERIWLAQDSQIMTHDTQPLWEALGNQPLPAKARQALMDLYAARKNAKAWGSFARQWQASAQHGGSETRTELSLDERPVALLATNVLGDSLTLGREHISPSMADWIIGTLRYFAANPQAQLVLRVHPGELLTHGTSMLQVIGEAFPELPENVRVIAPGDPTNTYDLVEMADMGLVFTTTVGLEMAMAGLPVIVAGTTHYAGKGFTLDPQSWQEYEALLQSVTADPGIHRLSPSQIEQAWLYAYLFFFEFSLPFPWHLVWLGEDFSTHPMRFVLNPQGQARYARTFSYLVGKPLDWRERGLARLDDIETEAMRAG